MKHLLLDVFLFTSGCAELVTYTLVSAGTLTGQIAHDKYNEYLDEKEKKDDDNSGTERDQKR